MMPACRVAAVFVLALICLLAGPARAQISVSEMVVDILPDHPLHDLIVGNVSDEVAYVQIDVIEILDPGTPEQTFIEGLNANEAGLLTTPSRLVLNPGDRALVRIAPITRLTDRDRVYWVRVRPVVGALESDESVIHVLFGYDVLTIVRPEQVNVSYTVERNGNRIHAVNTGNTMVELAYGEQCNAQGENCIPAPGKRLYAGLEWSAELPFDGPVRYTMTVVDETFKQEF